MPVRVLVLVGLLCLGASACSDAGGSDDNRYRGFYGGVSGGMTTIP